MPKQSCCSLLSERHALSEQSSMVISLPATFQCFIAWITYVSAASSVDHCRTTIALSATKNHDYAQNNFLRTASSTDCNPMSLSSKDDDAIVILSSSDIDKEYDMLPSTNHMGHKTTPMQCDTRKTIHVNIIFNSQHNQQSHDHNIITACLSERKYHISKQREQGEQYNKKYECMSQQKCSHIKLTTAITWTGERQQNGGSSSKKHALTSN